jgi:hypothetical protein
MENQIQRSQLADVYQRNDQLPVANDRPVPPQGMV